MKFNEYVNEQNKKKIDRKKANINEKQQKGIVRVLKAIPNLAILFIKTTFKIIGKILKMGFMLMKWLVNEFLECLMLLNHIFTTLSERKQKVVIGIVCVLLLLLTSYTLYTRHQNNVLNDDIATIEQSITGDNTDNNNKTTTVKNNNNSNNNKTENTEVEKTIKQTSNEELFGNVYFDVFVKGKSDYYGKGYVRYKENDDVKVSVCNTYGLGEFTDSPKSGSRYVKNVTDYIKNVDPTLYEEYFGNVNAPGTTTFTTGWQTAARKEEDKMKEYQFQYLYLTYVKNTMEDLSSKYSIDTNNAAMKELVFATAVNYGYKGTMYIFEQAGIEKGMSVEDVINKVEKEKINSIGTYTYTDTYKYDDQDRESMKAKIEKEQNELSNLI